MIQLFDTERFEEIILEDGLQLRYAISNFGRLVSFAEKIENGRLIKGSMTEGFRIFRYRIRQGKKILYRHKFFYRLVAENFLKKTSDDQVYVLHLDHNLSNDLDSNLKWATKDEMLQHQRTNPRAIHARKVSTKRIVEYATKRDGYKLTSIKVMHIKMLLTKPNRKIRLKTIAK